MKIKFKQKEYKKQNNKVTKQTTYKELNLVEKIRASKLLKEEIEKNPYPVVGCLFNNEYQNLEYEIDENGTLELIDTSTKEGGKIYARTVVYVMGKAFESLYPNERVNVDYQLGNALFCVCDNLEITDIMLEKLKQKMQSIIDKNLQIRREVMNREEAERFYEKTNTFKGRLQFDIKENQEIYMYYCEDYYNYCYGTLANRTGVIWNFDVVKYNNGFLLRYPSSKEPLKMEDFKATKKLGWAFDEYEKIHKLLNIETVYRLNQTIENGTIKDVIMLAEALHEKKIANIADDIARKKDVKMILIAGPSSSGKTTFAQRLGIQLRLNGIKPVTISVDNYFVERQDTPRDENGEYDFENIEAIDLKLLNDHLIKLLNGEEIEMPQFDFHVGTKRYNGKMMKLAEDEVLVIEGIHCLNDKLTNQIPPEQKYKIYISALTVLNMDRYNRISTTDTRLVRRIVRDYQFRGYSAIHTIDTWHKVNEGEEKNIFPYQEEANKIFNTSLIYELCALKPVAMPLLKEIKNDVPEYAEAKRLIDILKYFDEIPKEIVPGNSLLKEFLGGGNFKY